MFNQAATGIKIDGDYPDQQPDGEERSVMMRFRCAPLPLIFASALLTAFSLHGSGYAKQVGPVAILERDKDGKTAFGSKSFLREGTSISLNPDESIVVSYLLSCKVESITGGTVTIGADESTVVGAVEKKVEEVDCDGAPITCTAQAEDEQDMPLAAMTIGRPPWQENRPDRIVFHSHPVFLHLAAPEGTIAFSLLEHDIKEGNIREFKQVMNTPDAGSVVDLAREELALQPGSVYAVTHGDDSLNFKVSWLSITDSFTEGDLLYIRRLIPVC